MSRIKGLKGLKSAIKKHKKVTAKGLRVGLFRAGLFLQRESQKIVPVDKNFLRPSATTRATGNDRSPEVVVGYGTDYALYVHEDMQARHKPGKSAKFLEKPLRENEDRLGEIVLKGIKSEL